MDAGEVRGGGLSLEIRRRRGGGLWLRLGRETDPDPYISCGLDAMLLVSTGSPWRPAFPGLREAELRRTGDELVVRGAVGPLAVEASFAFRDGLLHAGVTWRNPGTTVIRDLAVGLAIPLPDAAPDSVTLPQVLYRGNPSADPDRTVPRLCAGGGLVVEEHRLPVPCAHAEWAAGFLTLYACTPGDGSLGALAAGPTTLLALSGPLLLNGAPDVAYTHKATTSPRPRGYRDLPPGAALTTHHALHGGRPERPGHGFRAMVHEGLRLYEPTGAPPLSLGEIIELKTAALDRRWHEHGATAGYLKFTGPGHEPGFMYGWTGQALKLAWCDARLGLRHADEHRLQRCYRAVDFYLDGSAAAAPPGLRMSFHRLSDGSWSTFERDGQPLISARAYGDTLADLADVITLLRAHDRPVPERWAHALDEGLDAVRKGLTPDGMIPLGWRLDGTPHPGTAGAAGLPCVLAMLKAASATGTRRHRETAVRLLERYHARHATDFSTPFCHATLDAACEDKEAGMAFFQCAYELLRLTGETRYGEWAAATADWLLTWVYQWNPPYPPGSPLRESGFSAVGWPGVSVQNHHLDAFFPARELRHLGELTGRRTYVELAELILHALGQGICTRPGEWGFDAPGEQAEGFYPTDWQERGTSNTWNPSWVTAQVLSQALAVQG
ncbi:hypothetical protein G5C51_27965 [Streptomyces sp. A7024]|uniref:Uncharacterized protein n=1 Tax=Streptomyces coryli TaxID=1128680 RepID=A0A6G4U6J5_9ACTN|nr:hypothetical protein [Streptomyces coryli]NGN67723.1 hypothetical protein [Streptomyces coryli]